MRIVPPDVPADARFQGVKPFLKWPGGKRSLAEHIAPLVIPGGWYFEPMLGGGAVYFHLLAKGLVDRSRTVLSDGNIMLIHAYQAVARAPAQVLIALEALGGSDRETYERVRKEYNEMERLATSQDRQVQQAARLIYLNRVGFNGLYRVNKDGRFNVPWGGEKRVVRTPDFDANLMVCSLALQVAEIGCNDFRRYEHPGGHPSWYGAGDTVYFDPPYPGTFNYYTASGFDHQHERLLELASRLRSRGVRVIISLPDTEEVRLMYKHFSCIEVSARRSVGAKASTRKVAGELILF